MPLTFAYDPFPTVSYFLLPWLVTRYKNTSQNGTGTSRHKQAIYSLLQFKSEVRKLNQRTYGENRQAARNVKFTARTRSGPEYMVQETENISHNSPRLNIITYFYSYTFRSFYKSSRVLKYCVVIQIRNMQFY